MRIIHDREYDDKTRHFSQPINGSPKYEVNFDRLMTERGTSVSSATWITQSGSVSISNQSFSSNVATANISGGIADDSLIKLTATLADGSTRVKYLCIKTIDPENHSYNDDYGRY